MILSTIAALDLKACQFDIGTAFLECELDEDIYMRLPDYLGGKIWKLNRAIYGLPGKKAAPWGANFPPPIFSWGTSRYARNNLSIWVCSYGPYEQIPNIKLFLKRNGYVARGGGR